MRTAGFALGLCLVVCAPAAHAQLETPSQCRSYGAVFDFYGGSSHFQNFGLDVEQCRSLCRKHAARCKEFLKRTRACSKKAIADQLSIDLKTRCDTLESSAAREACRRDYKGEAAEQQSAHDASVAELIGNCDVVVRGWCSDECER